MTCLPEHPHAFITDGVVTGVAVFAAHDADVINAVGDGLGADLAVCCCNLGVVPPIGSTWDGTAFTLPDHVIQPHSDAATGAELDAAPPAEPAAAG